jgi:hypothetical protein
MGRFCFYHFICQGDTADLEIYYPSPAVFCGLEKNTAKRQDNKVYVFSH